MGFLVNSFLCHWSGNCRWVYILYLSQKPYNQFTDDISESIWAWHRWVWQDFPCESSKGFLEKAVQVLTLSAGRKSPSGCLSYFSDHWKICEQKGSQALAALASDHRARSYIRKPPLKKLFVFPKTWLLIITEYGEGCGVVVVQDRWFLSNTVTNTVLRKGGALPGLTMQIRIVETDNRPEGLLSPLGLSPLGHLSRVVPQGKELP